MGNRTLHSVLATNLALGACVVTLFLLTGSVTDPVNATKLLILGGVSIASLALVIQGLISGQISVFWTDLLVLMFTAWGLIAVMKSTSPISQNIYGVYGRNTGWLTYFFFALYFVAGTKVRGTRNFQYVVFAFSIAAVVNIVYNSWVIVFGDFIGWQNNYGAILGTFGNPNFASSFLGIAFSVNLVAALKVERKYKPLSVVLIPVIGWQLMNSGSIQGNVVAVLGTWLVGFFWMREKFSKSWVSATYLSSGLVIAIAGVIGVFGSGPLRNLLAQPTIALREQYWLAAVNMAKSNPVFGVGMDSYGDWYRRSREAQALITPGPETVTNAAHSVYLDLLAYGGVPLLALYLAILITSLVSVVRVVKRSKSFDPIFVTLTIIWICYQVQAAISINQIGLAIWGWLTSGLLIAYERNFRNLQESKVQGSPEKKNPRKKPEILSPGLVSVVGLIVGLILAAPPINADMKWSDLQRTRDANLLTRALSGTYMVPINSFRLAQAVELLENSKLPDLAIQYARRGVEFNPNSFTAWQMLYLSTNSTPDEKIRAQKEMIRLDPLNSSWEKLK
jgi:O-antigen ligase